VPLSDVKNFHVGTISSSEVGRSNWLQGGRHGAKLGLSILVLYWRCSRLRQETLPFNGMRSDSPPTGGHLSIKRVDFGRVDAEGEDRLADYFVDTGVMSKVTSGRKYLVVGRKGAGKTALFKLVNDQRVGHDVIPLDFADYPWEAHKLIQESGLNPESAYVASWRFTLLAAVCRRWMDVAPSEVRKQAASLMRRIYQDEEPGLVDILFDKFRRVRKVQLPEMTGAGNLGGFELDAGREGPVLAHSVSQWCRVLEELVAANLDKCRFTIKLDRLDDGWDASTESKMLLAGVLKAARDLNLKFGRNGSAPPALVFLRTDIFNELRFNDKNKMTADIELLEWPDDKLIDVAAARIAWSLDMNRTAAWDHVFSRDSMRQGARISSYILKRTMGRPRDIIAFCLACQDVASGDVVQTQDVYEAEGQYSRHIYDELDDEMHKQMPENRTILQALRGLGKMRFTLPEWIEAMGRTEPGITADVAKQRLKVLFEYSIVGVPRKGGVQRGTRFQFNYNDRLVEPDFEAEVTVHPALKKHLQLIEARRDSTEAEDE
jgi:hypothetical protein